ncbi:MAG: hypothetical protein ACHQU1_09940 [Gemmatimonadales bacterium]
MHRTTLCLSLIATALALPLAAQEPDTIPIMRERTIDGPRMGFTYISGPKAEAKLVENHLDPLMSLFGWHFEQIVRPQSGGPAFVIQEVMLVAGVDQGTAIPSGTLMLGIRFPHGFEFGMGPNVTPLGTAMAVGIGKSLRYGGVTIPVNFAIVRSQGALRTSILVGYAIRRS